MSKMLSKTDTTRIVLQLAIAFAIISLLTVMAFGLNAVLSVSQSAQAPANPVEVQQAAIQKAYDLIKQNTF